MKKLGRNYTEEEIQRALDYYHECKGLRKTIRDLGYPSKSCLMNWINAENNPKPQKKIRKNYKQNSYEEKMTVIHRCVDNGEDIHLLAKEFNLHKSTIYTWRRLYLREGPTAFMAKKKQGKRTTKDIQSNDVNELKAQLLDLQLENDILRETIDILKKDPGIDQTALKNSEKAVIVDALVDRYSLPIILEKLQLSRSSYYYQRKRLAAPDKYEALRTKIIRIFDESKGRYGYRRIWAVLSTGEDATTISEKVVRRIMKEENLVAKRPHRKKYSSYEGEISAPVENKVNRNFKSDKLNELWLTDISEFAIPAGKVYLSPLLDCFDGGLVTWKIGTSPSARLVNTMLDDGINQLSEGEHPIVHSDRGCHYQWPGWIERMEHAHLIRSMSKKGCSPDNSACEGFFGRLKVEMFYGIDWSGVSIDEFIEILNDYLVWYNEKRIKSSLGYMSPMEYRRALGLVG